MPAIVFLLTLASNAGAQSAALATFWLRIDESRTPTQSGHQIGSLQLHASGTIESTSSGGAVLRISQSSLSGSLTAYGAADCPAQSATPNGPFDLALTFDGAGSARLRAVAQFRWSFTCQRISGGYRNDTLRAAEIVAPLNAMGEWQFDGTVPTENGTARVTVRIRRARPSCGNIGPIKAWTDLPGGPPTAEQIADAETLEGIAFNLPKGDAQHNALLSGGWVTHRIDGQLHADASRFQAALSAAYGRPQRRDWPARTSGYRPLVYQRHFWDLAQLRVALDNYILRPSNEIERARRKTECAALLADVSREVRTHGIARKMSPQRDEDFKHLAVSNPDAPDGHDSAHPIGAGLDLNLRGLSLVVVESLLAASNLGRPYWKDPVHVELATSPANLKWTTLKVSARSPVAPDLAYDAGAQLALLVVAPDGRRVGVDPDTGAIVNEIGPHARVLLGGGGVAEIFIAQADLGSYRVGGIARSTGAAQIAVVRNGDDDFPLVYSTTASAGVPLSGVDVALDDAPVDRDPPVVSAPPQASVQALSMAGVVVGVSQELMAFLAGSSAVDDRDDDPVLKAVLWNGVAVDDATVLPIGNHSLVFEYADSSGNVGNGTSTVQVHEPLAGAPPPPAVTASVVGNVLNASWSVPTGSALTRYTVFLGTRAGARDFAAVNVGLLTSGDAPLPPGVYYLSVMATNGPHSVLSSETRLRVGPEAPLAPDLDAAVIGTNVTLSWRSYGVAAGISYRLLAGSRSGSSDIAVLDLGATESVSGNLPPGTYFLRVEAATSGGRSTSREVMVRTSCDPPPVPVGLDAGVTNGQAAIRWPAVPSAQTYRLQAGSAPRQADLFDGDVGSLLAISATPPPGVYYVRLVAQNACGASAPSADVRLVVP